MFCPKYPTFKCNGLIRLSSASGFLSPYYFLIGLYFLSEELVLSAAISTEFIIFHRIHQENFVLSICHSIYSSVLAKAPAPETKRSSLQGAAYKDPYRVLILDDFLRMSSLVYAA